MSNNKKTIKNKCNSGFTLVELSIVLVIIGLLVGGVLSGQSLIRSAELRAISSEYMKYTAAENAFRDKYFAIPGDMNNGASFWPTVTNGDGNGQVTAAAAASASGEMFQYWNELALAGIIEGSYTGLASATGSGSGSTPGTNVPKSKVGNGAWAVQYASATYGNTFYFGATTSGNLPTTGILLPQEAWNVDTKLDDGNPTTGKVVASGTTGAAGATNCIFTGGAAYNLSDTGQECALNFIKAF